MPLALAELEPIDDYRWRIPRTGGMRVPGILFADRMLVERMLSDRTPDQVRNAAHLPGILEASIAMPDAHWGYGLPVGGVIATDPKHGVVSPGAVGYDIGCGVRLMRTCLTRAELVPHLERLADALFHEVPCGVGSSGAVQVSKTELNQVLSQGAVTGNPMQDLRVVVYDGKHHPVDSKEVAFVAAGRKAFLDAVGKAGQLLTKIIEAIGMTRGDVYIANVIKCRPPNNRNPEPDEVERCEPFLFRQIDVVKPKVIVALGKFAAQCLLRTSDPITRIRGREYKYRSAILLPTYHPAYLLRNPSAKREVWEDMKRERAILVESP